jgi:hypothetical protein
MRYCDMPHRTWAEILAENDYEWTPPRTVHLPIHPAYSSDFVHVDCSLNVCRRRMLPGLSVTDPQWQAKAWQDLEALLVEMLPADPPLVPQGQACRFSLAEGRHPIVTAEYFADVLYRFEYFCAPTGRAGRNLLWVTCTVINTSTKTRPVTARARIGFVPEQTVFDYHYIPFYWDHTKYRHPTRSGLRDGWILRDDRPVGRVCPGSFACEWEQEAVFDDKGYEALAQTHYVEPANRFSRLTECVRFRRELAPGEEASFALVLLTDYEAGDEQDHRILEQARPDTARQEALRHFTSLAQEGSARLVAPTRKWDRLFTMLQNSSLQLMLPWPGVPGLAPTQGGSSERHFVWVWEAVFMLMPLLKTGHFKPVREALAFLFSLQDSGCPPEGRFTATTGSIGTTGPRWINTTGAALALASDYCLYAGDETFRREYLPRMLRAADWIAGELRATRKLNADGSRPLTHGLMPFGCATDGDVGHVLSFSDGYTYWGLDKLVGLLKRCGHPRAAEFERERDLYRADIRATVAALARPAGFIDRKIITGDPQERYAPGFEIVCGIGHLVYCGALDPCDGLFSKYVDYSEAHLRDGSFTGKMNPEVYYMGTLDLVWQDIYLKRGEWKKAFLAVQTNMKYGMTQDTFQVQERFSISNPAFTPFQPNGSGNGRILDMMIRSFYFEEVTRVTLLAGIPFLWLRMNGRTALTGLHTLRGEISLEAETTGRQCRLCVSAPSASELPERFRIPEHYRVEAVTGAVETGGAYAPQPGTRQVVFLLGDND